jgi:hypothetical protein
LWYTRPSVSGRRHRPMLSTSVVQPFDTRARDIMFLVAMVDLGRNWVDFGNSWWQTHNKERNGAGHNGEEMGLARYSSILLLGVCDWAPVTDSSSSEVRYTTRVSQAACTTGREARNVCTSPVAIATVRTCPMGKTS